MRREPARIFFLAAGVGAALVALFWGAVAGASSDDVAGRAFARRAQTGGLAPTGAPFPADCRIPKSMLTAGSRAVGRPGKGRLVKGVPLPEESDFWFTWNFPGGFSPNPDFRRYGTEKLVLTVECVLSAYGARHPELARAGVADLSLTHGGPFYGRKYGGLGHGSHQNGLDVDVLMPRLDLCECAPILDRCGRRPRPGAGRRLRGGGCPVPVRLPRALPPRPAARPARSGHPAALPRRPHTRPDPALGLVGPDRTARTDRPRDESDFSHPCHGKVHTRPCGGPSAGRQQVTPDSVAL